MKLQSFGHLMQRADSFEKIVVLGKIEGGKRRGWQRMRWLDGIADSMDMGWVDSGSWWWVGRPGMLWFMGSPRVRHDWMTELNASWRMALCPPSVFELELQLCSCSSNALSGQQLLGGTKYTISSMIIGQNFTTMAHQWVNWFSATLCGLLCQGKQHPISFETMVMPKNLGATEMWTCPMWEGLPGD